MAVDVERNTGTETDFIYETCVLTLTFLYAETYTAVAEELHLIVGKVSEFIPCVGKDLENVYVVAGCIAVVIFQDTAEGPLFVEAVANFGSDNDCGFVVGGITAETYLTAEIELSGSRKRSNCHKGNK